MNVQVDAVSYFCERQNKGRKSCFVNIQVDGVSYCL